MREAGVQVALATTRTPAILDKKKARPEGRAIKSLPTFLLGGYYCAEPSEIIICPSSCQLIAITIPHFSATLRARLRYFIFSA